MSKFSGGVWAPTGVEPPPPPLKEKMYAPSWQIAEAPVITDLTDFCNFIIFGLMLNSLVYNVLNIQDQKPRVSGFPKCGESKLTRY